MGRAGAGELDFRVKQRAFGVQNIQVRGIAVVVTQTGQFRGLAQAVYGVTQGFYHEYGAILNGQSVASLLEGLLNGQHIGGRRFALGGLAGLHVVGDTPEGENGQIDAAAYAPDVCGALKQMVEFAALGAELAGQRDGREPFRPGRADFEVGRLEVGFRRDEVGAAFQKIGGQAHGQLRGAGHGFQFEAAFGRGFKNITRRAAGQHHERAFRRGHLILRGVQAGPHTVNFRLGAQKVQLADQAFVVTGAVDFQRFLAGGQSAFGNAELGVITAQADVGRGGLPSQAEHHAALPRFRSQQLFACSRGGVAHLAPQVHFPYGLKAERELVVDAPRRVHGKALHAEQFADGRARRDVAFRGFGAPGTAGTGECGEELGPGQPQIGSGLIHTGNGRREVLVVQQGFFHQFIQHRVIEALPPLNFKALCGHGQIIGCFAPGVRDVHFRAVVIRGKGAAGQRHARKQAEGRARAPESGSSHISSPSQSML